MIDLPVPVEPEIRVVDAKPMPAVYTQCEACQEIGHPLFFARLNGGAAALCERCLHAGVGARVKIMPPVNRDLLR